MKVTDHNKFRLFDYENDLTNPNFELGQVVIKLNDDKAIETDCGNPIGVVIQLHDDGDCRTDMYGNVCPSEVRLATLSEIREYREDVIDSLIIGRFRTMFNVGKAKYVIRVFDGTSKHKDGSDFYGIDLFSNKRKFEAKKKAYLKNGYIEENSLT